MKCKVLKPHPTNSQRTLGAKCRAPLSHAKPALAERRRWTVIREVSSVSARGDLPRRDPSPPKVLLHQQEEYKQQQQQQRQIDSRWLPLHPKRVTFLARYLPLWKARLQDRPGWTQRWLETFRNQVARQDERPRSGKKDLMMTEAWFENICPRQGGRIWVAFANASERRRSNGAFFAKWEIYQVGTISCKSKRADWIGWKSSCDAHHARTRTTHTNKKYLGAYISSFGGADLSLSLSFSLSFPKLGHPYHPPSFPSNAIFISIMNSLHQTGFSRQKPVFSVLIFSFLFFPPPPRANLDLFEE